MSRNRAGRLSLVSIFVVFGLALMPIIVGHAQSERQLRLGSMTYSRAAAPALRMPVTNSAGFFRGVGGVAFSAVAQGQLGLSVQALQYDPTAADGQRLLISVRSSDGATRTVRGDLYDWQLVPIGRFALDDNGSAVTLFGRLRDRDAQAEVRAAGNRVINYHAELDNTLVGLRLLQADILVIQQNAADMFKEDGRAILGAGEGGHDIAQNLERFQRIAEWQGLQEQSGHQYESYVVGDIHQSVTFSVQDGSIAFTGHPYWNAWRPKYDSPYDQARERALRNRFNEMVDPHNALLNEIKAGKGSDRQLDWARRKLAEMKKDLDSISRRIEELNEVVEMPEYSRALTERVRELDGINPIVYRTAETVMHYRALFKHYQQNDQAGFAAFVKSLSEVPVQPPVTTPTIQRSASQ